MRLLTTDWMALLTLIMSNRMGGAPFAPIIQDLEFMPSESVTRNLGAVSFASFEEIGLTSVGWKEVGQDSDNSIIVEASLTRKVAIY